VTVYTVPAARLAANDLHEVHVETGVRAVTLYLRDPANRSVALGPDLAAPTFTRVPAGATVNVRANIPWQAEYGAVVSVGYGQSRPGMPDREVQPVASREYFGDRANAWSLTIPDFRGAPDFVDDWLLNDQPFRWWVTGTDRPHGTDWREARDGDVFHSARGSGSHP
jgi:hypothetical protein